MCQLLLRGRWLIRRLLHPAELFLSSGAYGEVYKAKLQQPFSASETVVLKKIGKAQDRQLCMDALTMELQLLVHIGDHPNVVKLLGYRLIGHRKST